MRAVAAFYLALVLMPLVVVLAGGVPPSQGTAAWALAMAAGFAGLAMMGAQGALTARFRRISVLGPIDRIYAWHKRLGVAAVLVVLAHPVVLVVDEPARLVYLDPFQMPAYIVAGQVSVALLLVLAATSVGRNAFRLSYEAWRALHDVAAAAAIVLAVVHVDGVRYYLGPPWKHATWLAAGAAWVALIAAARLVRPWRLRRRPYRVVSVTPDRGSAWVLAVEPVGHAGLRFRAGQFAWVMIGGSPFGAGDHPFSFSSAPDLPGGRLEFTIKALGDFSRTVGTIRPGAPAYVDGPYGSFTLEGIAAPGFVFIAGGIGIAPFLSLLGGLADAGDTRPHLLVHAGQSADRLTGHAAVEALRTRLRLTVVEVLAEPDEGWTGERGLVTADVLARHTGGDRAARHYFVCGPPALIRAVSRHLSELGVPRRHVHAERFEML
ncbi:MAG: ferric reductase-like transmembrane domain-containing protein [Vicinamibacterales bacterium]